jgi:hypothetical protein
MQLILQNLIENYGNEKCEALFPSIFAITQQDRAFYRQHLILHPAINRKTSA